MRSASKNSTPGGDRTVLPAALCLLILPLMNLTAAAQQEPASLLVTNARIHTMNAGNSIHEAMAIRDGRIIALGSARELEARYSPRERLDAKGATVLPGFIDAHAHLFGLGKSKMELNLRGTTSAEDVARIVKENLHRYAPGEWITGRGWDQNDWPNGQYPAHAILDEAGGDHPVYLKRVDGHAAWVNRRAMELCGISASTPDTAGGKILRDAAGSPTGILIDNATELVFSRIPPFTAEQMDRAYSLAIGECLRYGMTGIHDMGVSAPNIASMKRLIERKQFPFRVYAMIDAAEAGWEALLEAGRQQWGDNSLVIGGLKLYADGALGSRGALLFEPYSDDPGNTGLQILTQEEIRNRAARALDKNLQVCVHAIGDRANHLVLDAYEQVLASRPGIAPRLRIEHVQVLAPGDIPRFAALGVIPSMQPTHCTSDMYWAEARLGPTRVRGAYAWRSLRNTGAIIPGGSDFPVEEPNPILGIYAAVTRRDRTGRPTSQTEIDAHFQTGSPSAPSAERYAEGWFGDEKLTREEAVRAFTSWAAYASFQEPDIGTLEPGKLADFILLTDDPFTVPEAKIPDISVLATFVGGEKAYSP